MVARLPKSAAKQKMLDEWFDAGFIEPASLDERRVFLFPKEANGSALPPRAAHRGLLRGRAQ